MRQREQRGLTRGPYRRLAYEGIASASIWSDPHVEAAENAALGERDRHRCRCRGGPGYRYAKGVLKSSRQVAGDHTSAGIR